MKKIMYIGLLACCTIFNAVAADAAKVVVDELHLVRVPEKESVGTQCGTTVKFSLTHPTKQILGLDSKAAKITFVDSTGQDLLAAGKKQKAEYEKNKSGYSFSSQADKQNSVSQLDSNIFDRDKADPKQVLIMCNAMALPAKNTESITIKGKIALKVDSGKDETLTVSAAKLAAKKVIKLGTNNLKFYNSGTGQMGDDKFIYLSCDTAAVIKSISVVGKDSNKRLANFHKGSVNQKASVEVYESNLAPEDKVKIVYTEPQIEEVDIDITVALGFGAE